MQILWYVTSFVLVAWLVTTARNRRTLIAATLSGVLVLTLVGMPQPAHAQSEVLGGIQAVLDVIHGVLQTALGAINTVRTAMNNWQQVIAWPQQMISQARALVTQMISQYRGLTSSLFHMNLNSATLPVPQALETVLRDHQVNNFSSLNTTFANTYGVVPIATAANPTDRALSDMDDALSLDNLKLLKASDQAVDVELKSAEAMENAASQAAPGSAPLLTAAAVVSSVESEALSQKMLASALRQEAARLAHRNTLRKANATNTTALRGVVVNLLENQ